MNSEDQKKEEQQTAEQKDVQQDAAGEVKEEKSEAKGPETQAEEKDPKDSAQPEESAGQGSDEKEEENDSQEKKGFFKKKKDPRDEKIEELTDRVKRQMAEFENFRKRTEKEKSTMYEMGARDMIEKILPIIDNFERGLATIPDDAKGTPFAEGMEKIYKQLQKTMEDAGVKVIEAVGKEFDPNLHNAVMHVEDESLGENVVAEELL